MQVETDDGLRTFLEGLLRDEQLENPGQGVAKHAIARGRSSLSAKQETVLGYVLGNFERGPCMRCGESLSFDEMENARFSPLCVCSWCEHVGYNDN